MKTGIISRIQSTTRQNQKAVVFILCFFISVMFWIFTSMSREYESVQTIPVSYQNIPFTRNLEGSLPSHLEFHYKGTGFELFATYMRNRPDSIIVDVSKAMESNNVMNVPSITLRNQLPGELKAIKIVPETISQSFTTGSGKRIPVKAKVSFGFRNRFSQTGKLILTPDSIDIAGPAGMLEKISSINTQVIKLDDIHSNVFGSVYLANELPQNVVVSDQFVYYYLTVEEFTEGEFEIPIDLPASQRNRVTLLPSVVKVKFQAGLNHFRTIKPTDFQVVTQVPFPDRPAQLVVELKRYPHKLSNIIIEPRVVDYLLNE